jgi:hypothetical protein
MSVSFKVTLIKGQEHETRRFLVDQDQAILLLLQSKLEIVFPALSRSEFILSWVDSEGDEVRISTQEELGLAMGEMGGPLYKLRVRQGKRKEANLPLHLGVSCDGCQGAVRGRRYKCVQCPDYDLCKEFELQGLHPKHRMVRLSAPQGSPRLPAAPRGSLSRCPLPRHLGTRVLPGSCPNPSFQVMLGRMMGEARKAETKTSATGRKEPTAAKTEEHGEPGKTGDARVSPSCSPGPPAASLPASLSDLMGPVAPEQLEAAGSVLTSVLGPALASSLFPLLEALGKQQDGGKGAKEETLETPTTTTKATTTTTATEPEKEKPVLPEEESEFEMVSVEKQGVAEEGGSIGSGSLYPSLPSGDQARLWKTSLTQKDKDKMDTQDQDKKAEGEDPDSAAALATMEAMGFSDDGGWLSSLLKSKRGDVAGVLDTIHPNTATQ